MALFSSSEMQKLIAENTASYLALTLQFEDNFWIAYQAIKENPQNIEVCACENLTSGAIF